jgi:hypothetical protein
MRELRDGPLASNIDGKDETGFEGYRFRVPGVQRFKRFGKFHWVAVAGSGFEVRRAPLAAQLR